MQEQGLGENNADFDDAVQTLHTALENGDVGENRGGFFGFGGERMITKEQLEELAQPDSDASSDVRNAAKVLTSAEQDAHLALLDRAGPSNAPEGGNHDPLRGPSVNLDDDPGDDTYSISDTRAFIEMFGAS